MNSNLKALQQEVNELKFLLKRTTACRFGMNTLDVDLEEERDSEGTLELLVGSISDSEPVFSIGM